MVRASLVHAGEASVTSRRIQGEECTLPRNPGPGCGCGQERRSEKRSAIHIEASWLDRMPPVVVECQGERENCSTNMDLHHG
jgi:hypothetical protein